MDKVRSAVTEKKTWLNTTMQAQTQLARCLDPVTRCSQIKAETQVSVTIGSDHVINYFVSWSTLVRQCSPSKEEVTLSRVRVCVV